MFGAHSDTGGALSFDLRSFAVLRLTDHRLLLIQAQRTDSVVVLE